MPKCDVDTVEEFCDKNKKKNESRLQFFNRVLDNLFKANYWILYRGNRFIIKDKEGNLSLFQKLEDGKDEDTNH